MEHPVVQVSEPRAARSKQLLNSALDCNSIIWSAAISKHMNSKRVSLIKFTFPAITCIVHNQDRFLKCK